MRERLPRQQSRRLMPPLRAATNVIKDHMFALADSEILWRAIYVASGQAVDQSDQQRAAGVVVARLPI